MKIRLYLIFLIAIFLAGCIPQNSETSTDAQSLNQKSSIEGQQVSCEIFGNDISNSICPEGYTCYDSFFQPKGAEIGREEGDKICHKNCETDADCSAEIPNCKKVLISTSDTGEFRKLCFN